jgi:hypothetical protein
MYIHIYIYTCIHIYIGMKLFGILVELDSIEFATKILTKLLDAPNISVVYVYMSIRIFYVYMSIRICVYTHV